MAEQLLDLRGFICPMPVIKTKKALKALASEDSLRVIATDANAKNDIPHLCTLMKRELCSATHEKGEWIFVIK